MKKSLRIFSLFCLLLTTTVYAYSQGESKDEVRLLKPLEPAGERINPRGLKDKTANFFMTKKYKQATKQRDSLYALYEKIKSDTPIQGKMIRSLADSVSRLEGELKDCSKELAGAKDYHKKLQERYNDLLSASSNKESQLSAKLSERAAQLEIAEAELGEREKRLRDLESIIHKQDSTMQSITSVLKDALRQINSADLSIEVKNGKVYLSMNDKILFRSGKSEVQEEGIKAINKISQALNGDKTGNIDIMIEGHTDNVPIKTAQYADNWDLSVARATAITRLMVEMGVNPKRITASGKSEFSPKASNLDAEGRAKNRRTEIVLVPNFDEIYSLIQN